MSALRASTLLASCAVAAVCATAPALAAAPSPSGDIPDNQVFIRYTSAGGHWSIRFPEGWARTERGNTTAFHDKDSGVVVSVLPGKVTTPATVLAGVRALGGASVTGAPSLVRLPAGLAVLVRFTAPGAVDPVTGKAPRVATDRYVLGAHGRVATIDLSTPVGTDNVDTFRLISQSFGWR